jgi:RNA polymerase sigma factor (sigma-70 family)
MDRALDTQTSLTLLGRIKDVPVDARAWCEFVARYGPKIHAWCRRWGLREEDAREVTQTVLAKLAERMRTFAYDPSRSFHGWLKTVTHHAWRDFVKDQTRSGLGSGDTQVLEQLQQIEARDDLVAELDTEFRRELLETAMARVQLRVAPKTWRVFWMLAIEEKSGAEVAQEVGVTVNAAFVAKNRVKSMIEAEVARLRGADDD